MFQSLSNFANRITRRRAYVYDARCTRKPCRHSATGSNQKIE